MPTLAPTARSASDRAAPDLTTLPRAIGVLKPTPAPTRVARLLQQLDRAAPCPVRSSAGAVRQAVAHPLPPSAVALIYLEHGEPLEELVATTATLTADAIEGFLDAVTALAPEHEAPDPHRMARAARWARWRSRR